MDVNGTQRYLCHDCHRTFRAPPKSRTQPEEFQARVLAAYQERASMRGVCRLFGIGRNALSRWLKKATQLPPLTQTLAPPVPEDVLELDELCWNSMNFGRSSPGAR